MKHTRRLLSLLLALVLVLGLLPMTANAGGGGAWQVWREEFNDVTNFWSWQVIDANGDGQGFNTRTENSGGCSVRSAEPLGMLSVEPEFSDDYLISPPVSLGSGYEYTLYYRAGGTVAAGSYSSKYEIYVYTGEEELTAANLYTVLGERADLNFIQSDGWAGYRQIDLTAYAGMTVRLIFRSCTPDSGSLWLDDITVYCQEPDELLSKVTAINVPMPVPGGTAADLRESWISFPSFANYTMVAGSMTWYDITDEAWVKMTSQTFSEGREYAMTFKVAPKSGITATDTGVASVNGMSARFAKQSDGTVMVTYIPNRSLGEKAEVRDVHLRLDVPVPGGMPDEVAERWLADGSTDFRYDVRDITWTPWTGEFEGGEEYAVSITVAPKSGYDFADYVHATLNGEPLALEVTDYGLTMTKIYEEVEKEYVTVTFDANGHGTAPDPIRLPVGGCLWDVVDSLDDLKMPDTDGKVHWHWSTDRRGDRENRFAFYEAIYEDVTLYAIWLDTIDTLDLWLDAPAAGGDVYDVSIRADRYDDVTFDTAGWFTTEQHNSFAASLIPGGTYYAEIFVGAGTHSSFLDHTSVNLHGATILREERSSSYIDLYIKVTIPPRGVRLQTLMLAVDTPVPGASMSMAPEITCLNTGLTLETGDWWDSLDKVGDMDVVWGGGFRPGMTLYTEVTVHAVGGVTIRDAASLATEVTGAEVKRMILDDQTTLRVVLAVKVMDAYQFTVSADGPGLFLFSGEYGLTGLCDFAFVRAGDYTLTAFPDPNCTFVGWYDGNTLLSSDPVYSFTLSGHVERWRAVFTETEVKRIDVTLPIPAPGDEFGYFTDVTGAVITNGAPVDLVKDAWYNEWGISGVPLPFLAGRKFFAELSFRAKDGACLTENTEVYINGEPAKAWSQANVSTWYACSRNYTMNPFADVKESDWFFDAVMWAVGHDPQITSGTSKTKFSPGRDCTREQVVTFLWRAYGCQEPETTVIPFTDVPADAYYAKAVLWAVEQGITTGKSKTKFGVGSPCTREQVVTFLWRAEGKPEPESTVNPFTDVSEESYAYKAILWAVEKGITKGTSKTKFSPAKTCTRGQVVTFLYRDVVGEQ